RTHELARFARLLLQEGQWDGRQILPATYVRRMATERVDTSAITESERLTHGYGLGVWIDRSGMYRMDGRYGQYAIVGPRPPPPGPPTGTRPGAMRSTSCSWTGGGDAPPPWAVYRRSTCSVRGSAGVPERGGLEDRSLRQQVGRAAVVGQHADVEALAG